MGELGPVSARGAAKRTLSRALGRPLGELSDARTAEAEVISFDLFDTLIRRRCGSAEAVFVLAEEEYRRGHHAPPELHLASLRETAERTARRKKQAARKRGEEPGEEVSLGEICREMPLSPAGRAVWEAIERRIEYESAVEEPEAAALFRKLAGAGRRVVITSDMYLPAEDIEAILLRCGIAGYEHLFLSSGCGLRKRTGSLYRHAARELGVEPGRILHIGDNLFADALAARRAGYRTFLVRA